MLTTPSWTIQQEGACQYDCRVFAGAAQVATIVSVVDELRRRHGLLDDMTTALSWFVPRTVVWGNEPIVVLLRQDGQPSAAVLFYGRRSFGVPTGVVKGGSRTGDGLVIGPAHQRLAILGAASSAVLELPWVHTVFASLRDVPGTGDIASKLPPGLTWHSREVSTHLSLEGGFEGFLSRLRPRSRRNYRYFRRRGEHELGLTFMSALGPDEAVAAVEALYSVSMHPMPRPRAMGLEAAIRATPGSFVMGLRDKEGRWLSYIAGWRQPDATFVEWQLNHHEYEAASLSTVMRTYFLEHEAAQGVADVVFVGGTSEALGRYCKPDRCFDILAARRGVRGFIARQVMTRFRPQSQITFLLRGARADGDVVTPHGEGG